MKKYFPFELVKLTNHEMLVICKSYKRIGEFYRELEHILKKQKFNGIVYFDKLSYDFSNERFSTIPFLNKTFLWEQHKQIPGNNTFKSITCNYFCNHPEALENTILFEPTKQKIINGEII